MICTKRQEIRRQKNGAATTIFKCVNCLSDNFKKEVEKEICLNCPLKQMRSLGGCNRRKTCSVKFENDLVMCQGPCPDGFEKKENGFKSLWPDCPQAMTNNTVSREGAFLPVVFCTAKSRNVKYAECSKCFETLKKVAETNGSDQKKLEVTIGKDALLKAIEDQREELEEVPQNLPSLDTQIKNYSKAIYKWVTGGMDSRSNEEVERIYSICQACEFFKEGRCMVCGCRLANKGIAVTNKIKMSTEHCPKGKW